MTSISARVILAAAIVAVKCAAAPAGICFIDVNLVPMDTDRILLHQTVVVHDLTIHGGRTSEIDTGSSGIASD